MCCITIYDLIYILFSIEVFLFVTEHEQKTAEKQGKITEWLLTQFSSSTLYKLYAVPVRVCSTREDMHCPWVISSVPVRVCSTSESYPQYLWGYALPLSHIISTRESYPQYPWGYAVPVSHILSTREDMQYPWVISSVPVSHILGTCEDMQYLWVNLCEWRMNETSLTGTAYPHGYCISSQVLRIWLTGTDDMTHG